MEIEEWLSRVIGEMQVEHLELGMLLQMMERFSSQPCLSGCRVNDTTTALLDELVRCYCLLKTEWLSCAFRIGTLIGPAGRPEGR